MKSSAVSVEFKITRPNEVTEVKKSGLRTGQLSVSRRGGRSRNPPGSGGGGAVSASEVADAACRAGPGDSAGRGTHSRCRRAWLRSPGGVVPTRRVFLPACACFGEPRVVTWRRFAQVQLSVVGSAPLLSAATDQSPVVPLGAGATLRGHRPLSRPAAVLSDDSERVVTVF